VNCACHWSRCWKQHTTAKKIKRHSLCPFNQLPQQHRLLKRKKSAFQSDHCSV